MGGDFLSVLPIRENVRKSFSPIAGDRGQPPARIGLREFIHVSINRQYLKVRQQYRHLQACVGYLSRSAPDTRFILFGRGRSGTTALVSLLDALSAVRCEGEILHDYVPFPFVHVRGRSRRTRVQGYGCKILSYQLRDVQSALNAPRHFLRALHHRHGFDLLYLRRTNLLRHALSNIRARRDQFHRHKSAPAEQSPGLEVDPEHVLDWMRRSEALQRYEAEVLEGLPYLSLTYEEHMRDPSAHQSTVNRICDYLGVPSAPVQTEYQKLAPRSLRESVTNYEALARRLESTEYARFLGE
ncbi:MAG: Nodulation protein H [Salinibacter sp.]